ncbi:uncharacterized protein J4E84_006405 [Alternaria hordeiaustralica]|uniref:uncharacterized protein n=1 Tax=Alternaria hordeiaustralica TaxID=1187925 RepID=UPI0020C3F852|nr:uncharacterized protein J4E84_006405 [Alternaria hordeiaustralica]KAI4684415.1 hypothetical protein J4E84_006405 [Alternaria hordeiaustralica]
MPRRDKKSELRVVVGRLRGVNDIRIGTPAHPPSFLPPNTTPVAKRKPSITEYTFEQYQAANLNDDEKHAVIGKLRGELPIIDRDEVDEVLLRSMAQQLDLAVFPTCKMMQVDPAAVKRMLDDQFRKAYGAEVEASVTRKLGLCRVEDVELAVAAERIRISTKKKGKRQKLGKSEEMLVEEEEDAVATAPSPPTKEVKTAPKSIENEIKAHIARRKRAKQGVKMVMLRSEAVSQEWEKLSNAT